MNDETKALALREFAEELDVKFGDVLKRPNCRCGWEVDNDWIFCSQCGTEAGPLFVSDTVKQFLIDALRAYHDKGGTLEELR